jgi:type IV pilus assembly protein PilO
MARRFSIEALRKKLTGVGQVPQTRWKMAIRAVLGALLLLNVIAAVFVFRPPGGSPEELNAQLRVLTNQVTQKRATLARLRTVASKVEKSRAEGNAFLNGFFLSERSAYLTVLEELNRIVKDTKIKLKEHTFASEPIEGSTDLSMLTISGNLEGTYADLLEFVNRLDRSKHLIILESLQAQPQQTAGMLNVNVKLNTFVREAKPL